MANAFDQFDAPAANPFDQFDAPKVPAAPVDPRKAYYAGPKGAPSGLESFGMGVSDAPVGIGQMSAHAMDTAGKVDPWSTMGLLDKVRRASANVLGVGAEMPDVDKAIAEREAAYQARRATPGLTDLVTGNKPDPGIDWFRGLGNVTTALAVPTSGATTLAGRVGMGALQGGAQGMAQPVTSGNYEEEKLKQGALGAVVGGVATPIAGAIGNVIAPKVNPNVKTLMDAGVTPTPGQILGGGWAKLEDKLTSIPLVGDAIKSGQRRAINEFNTATYNKALAPIGQTAGKEVGPAGVKGVKDALSDAYEQLLPKLTFKPDQQLATEVAAITAKAQRQLPLDQARLLTNAIEDMRSIPAPNGVLSGKAYQDLMSDLGQDVKGYLGSSTRAEQKVGLALAEVRDAMRNALERSNPQYAKDLGAINKGYANYARIRGAGASLGKAEDLAFTPAQLLNAVKAGDKSVGKGAFATGDALLQDWAQAGKSVLSQKIPDSGTAGRLMAGGLGAGGLAFLSPTALGGAGLASAMYTTPGQKLVAALLTKRPQFAGPLANAVQGNAPLLSSAALPALLE